MTETINNRKLVEIHLNKGAQQAVELKTLWPFGSDFRAKKKGGLWNLPLQLRKDAEAKHVSAVTP